MNARAARRQHGPHHIPESMRAPITVPELLALMNENTALLLALEMAAPILAALWQRNFTHAGDLPAVPLDVLNAVNLALHNARKRKP